MLRQLSIKQPLQEKTGKKVHTYNNQSKSTPKTNNFHHQNKRLEENIKTNKRSKRLKEFNKTTPNINTSLNMCQNNNVEALISNIGRIEPHSHPQTKLATTFFSQY